MTTMKTCTDPKVYFHLPLSLLTKINTGVAP
jgi:hypothetical protein